MWRTWICPGCHGELCWSWLLAGAVAPREEPMQEQGLWGTCVLLEDPCWSRLFLEDWALWKGPMVEKWRTAEDHEGLYAKLIFPSCISFVYDNDCRRGWTNSLSLPQPTRQVHHISSSSPAEEMDEIAFWWAPDSQTGLTHHKGTLGIFGLGVGFFACNFMAFQRCCFMECHP